VYRFASLFARAWREAGGNPLAVLVPSPSSGAEFEGRPGSSPRRFFWFLPRLVSRSEAWAAVAVTQGPGEVPVGGISAPPRAPVGARSGSGKHGFVRQIQ
jgi:hypothetical protein